jgi:hypothetical protein
LSLADSSQTDDCNFGAFFIYKQFSLQLLEFIAAADEASVS